jgi:hypothetical protein
VQLVVAGSKPSAGQEPDDPVQVSAISHGPVDGRHDVVAGWNPSTQWPAPSQESVPSHAPPFDVPVQPVVAGSKPSAGQVLLEPEQLSARSHGPVEGRHVVVADEKPSTQCPAPSQESVPSQTPPFEVPVQVVVAGSKPSAGQLPSEPVQLSATSHGPVEGRQVVVTGWKSSIGQTLLEPVQRSSLSHGPDAGRHTVLESV